MGSPTLYLNPKPKAHNHTTGEGPWVIAHVAISGKELARVEQESTTLEGLLTRGTVLLGLHSFVADWLILVAFALKCRSLLLLWG